MNYAYQRDTVAAQIADTGVGCVLRTFSDEPNGNQPWKPGLVTEIDTAIIAVFTQYEEKYVDGDQVHTDDQKVLIAAKDLELAPDLNGQIIRGDDVFKIVRIKVVKPADIPLLYIIQARR